MCNKQKSIYVGIVDSEIYGVKKYSEDELKVLYLNDPTYISIGLGEDGYVFVKDKEYLNEYSDVLMNRILEVHKQLLLKNEFIKAVPSK